MKVMFIPNVFIQRSNSKNSRTFSFWVFPTTAAKDLFLSHRLKPSPGNENNYSVEKLGKKIMLEKIEKTTITVAVLGNHTLLQVSEARKT